MKFFRATQCVDCRRSLRACPHKLLAIVNRTLGGGSLLGSLQYPSISRGRVFKRRHERADRSARMPDASLASRSTMRNLLGASLRQDPSPRLDTRVDIALLAMGDATFGLHYDPATREICRRMHRVRGDERFVRLARISSSHIQNLRASRDKSFWGISNPHGAGGFAACRGIFAGRLTRECWAP